MFLKFNDSVGSIDEDSDFFVFSEVFIRFLFKKLRKSLVEFFGHIYQIDFLISMIKKFVVYNLFQLR